MTNSDTTKIAVLAVKVDELKEDVKEIRNLVGDKIATKEFVNDRVGPLKKLVYWMLGLTGSLLIGLIMAVVGLAVNK